MQNLRNCENSFNFFILRFNQYNGGRGDGMWCPDTEIMRVFMYILSSFSRQMCHQPFFSLLILARMERMGRQSSSEICSGSPGMLGTACSNCPISTPSISPLDPETKHWDYKGPPCPVTHSLNQHYGSPIARKPHVRFSKKYRNE